MRGAWIFAGDGCRGAALQVRDPLQRPPRLQPVELRARALLPAARRGARRAARLLVGADVGLARAGAGDHRRRRARDPARACTCSGSRSASGSRSRPGIGVLAAERARDDARAGTSARSRAGYFWWVLVTSPEILVFLFFMITDPKTIPDGRHARRVYAVGVGLARHAPDRSADDRVRDQGRRARSAGARLRRAPAARDRFPCARHAARPRPGGLGAARPTVGVACPLAGAWPSSGWSCSPASRRARAPSSSARADRGCRRPPPGDGRAVERASHRSSTSARRCRSLATSSPTCGSRETLSGDATKAGRAAAASGAWLAELWRQIRAAAETTIVVPAYRVERMQVTLEPGEDQAPPVVVATLEGTVTLETYGQSPTTVEHVGDAARFEQTIELALEAGRYKISRFRGAPGHAACPARLPSAGAAPVGRRSADGRCSAGRPRLPPRRVPLRRVARRDGDDGRRSVLARLRRGRMARPVRRQLLLGARHQPLGAARRPAAQRPVPQRARARSRT